MPKAIYVATVATLAMYLLAPAAAPGQLLGQLESHGDIGTILHKGDTVFDPAQDTYRVTGSGDNLWFTADDMQFAWKKVSGDIALTADIDFIGAKGNSHRKAALMIRQSLDANSAYADVARHGDGLTSLQYRHEAGEATHEVQTPATAPRRVRIERRGNFAYVFLGDGKGPLRFSGASVPLTVSGSFYVGLAVCSHDKDVTETAIFSHLQIEPLPVVASRGRLWSTLETVKVASSDRRVAYTAPGGLEAPNWTRDRAALIYNQDGRMHRFALDPAPYPSYTLEAVEAAKPTPIPTGQLIHINGNHGISPDGTQLAISDETGGASRIYVLPVAGGTPRPVTQLGRSLWHSWSPDGKSIAFSAQRAGASDVYTVPAAGGKETRLTQAPGLNGGADYTPDGAWIYFHSERTGHMQLWRMHPDGTNQEQALRSDDDDWFPHPSPNGKWVVYLAYKQNVKEGAERQLAQLRLMSVADGKVRLLAELYGGPGTIPVPSWSPDSTAVAFVSYSQPE